jgi:DNA-binding MarR family transcriptional regulator
MDRDKQGTSHYEEGQAEPRRATITPRRLRAILRATMNQDPVSLSEYQSVAELRAALRKFLRVSERAARRHGLTQQRYLLLLMIKGAADGSQRSTATRLAEQLQLAQSTVTEHLARAEEAGLVTRDPSTDDGRVVFFSLTPEGERRLAALLQDLRTERASLARMVGAFAQSQLVDDPQIRTNH